MFPKGPTAGMHPRRVRILIAQKSLSGRQLSGIAVRLDDQVRSAREAPRQRRREHVSSGASRHVDPQATLRYAHRAGRAGLGLADRPQQPLRFRRTGVAVVGQAHPALRELDSRSTPMCASSWDPPLAGRVAVAPSAYRGRSDFTFSNGRASEPVRIDAALSVTWTDSIARLVAADAGIALLPDYLPAAGAQRAAIVEVLPRWRLERGPADELVAFFLPGGHLRVAARALLDFPTPSDAAPNRASRKPP
jgi:hypothetical protein